MLRGLGVAAIALFSVAPAFALGSSQPSDLGAIDVMCATRSDRALAHPARRFARIFADPTTTSSAWRAADGPLMRRIATDPDVYSEVADVWRINGIVAVVNVESRSIEFREDASYCFRTDGTLARMNDTSSGTDNIDDETRYFTPDGRVIARSSHLALLHPTPGRTLSPDLRAANPTIFPTTKSLPFFALLTARRH